MTNYEIYVFFLCLIVFIMLVTMFSILLNIVIKQRFKLVRGGLEDEALKIEYTKQKESTKKTNFCGCFVSLAVCFVFIAFFIFSLVVNLCEDRYYENVPTMKVVNTGSMSYKNPKNEYLFKNDINNQFQAFDLVFVYAKPAESELKLYDVIVYETNGSQIIHRIIGIEEPNPKHPNERYFLCQGDAVEQPDYFPVYYHQIIGIYKNDRIPFIGSFIKFMQSPAGWLCAAFIVFGVFGMPVLERKMENVQLERLKEIGFITEDDISGGKGKEKGKKSRTSTNGKEV